MYAIVNAKAYLFVSQRVDDGNVTTQRHNKNAVGRRDQHAPERSFREPETTE